MVGLAKSYGGRTVLADVTFSVSSGEVLVLRGANGSGKTTLLACLLGARPVDAGTVLLDGQAQDVASSRYWADVYGVLDDFAWLPEITVGDHVRLLDSTVDPAVPLARFAAELLAGRTVASLSSGQKRRAALATTLVRPWRVLLLDEPEQRLDDEGIARLADVVHELRSDGRIVVLSTHSDHLQALLAGRVLTLRDE